jgi:decaprenylphospho-beta-D-ribofuranose 2-oxidase
LVGPGVQPLRKADVTLAGWGRVAPAHSQATRPERFTEALAEFRAPAGTGGMCLYGAGRSYGDCALNDGGAALITSRLDRILAFDPASQIVQVEPGVDFRRLLAVFLPRGFLAPVTPGTGFATIGGAVANDVHGKNHEHDGSFCQHVTELDLVLPSGELRTITPDDGAIFRATCGGLGLTGLITRIAFRVRAVPGGSVTVRERRVDSLTEFLAVMERAQDAPYSVGWIDGTATGASLGRGILETAELSAGGAESGVPRARAVPVDFPGFALNPLSVRAFNALYFRRVPAEGRLRQVPVGQFLYPLDAIHGWNRIYGKRGFYQFQCVVPFTDGAAVLRELLQVIAASQQASFLAVLKRMGAGRSGFLSFPMPGYTLALDFPRKAGVEALYARLCEITLKAGGRVYLGKDALLSAEAFRQMYPEFGEFRAALKEVDPEGRMQSGMAKRLRLHE